MQRWVAGLVALGLGALLVAVSVVAGDEPVVRGSGIASAVAGDDPDANVRQVAGQIFGDYIVAFELTSILLVVAVVGTVVMARRKRVER
jgi:NADH-quinone oxidoreductase subunit J